MWRVRRQASSTSNRGAIDLCSHPAAKLNEPGGQLARAKLGVRNLHEFASAELFDAVGRVACLSGVVPRKELFECYAAALLINERFPEARRVADLCSGHGLLAWFLLLLNDNRTAVCVDIHMPG